jgi:hypothetical protein
MCCAEAIVTVVDAGVVEVVVEPDVRFCPWSMGAAIGDQESHGPTAMASGLEIFSGTTVRRV